jgi:hypothetical protein
MKGFFERPYKHLLRGSFPSPQVNLKKDVCPQIYLTLDIQPKNFCPKDIRQQKHFLGILYQKNKLRAKKKLHFFQSLNFFEIFLKKNQKFVLVRLGRSLITEILHKHALLVVSRNNILGLGFF